MKGRRLARIGNIQLLNSVMGSAINVVEGSRDQYAFALHGTYVCKV
jgi:hypothetical protein